MLHDTLAQADRNTRQRRRRLVAVAALSTAAVALFLVGVIRVDLSRLGLSSTPETPAAEAHRAAAPPSPPSPTAPQPDPAERGAFKAALAAFEQDLTPRLSTDEFAAWDRAAQEAALAGKAEAIRLFSAGRYPEAVESLAAAAAAAREALAGRDQAFATALGAAEAAYAADAPEAAAPAIAEALRLAPDSPEAQDLKEKIDRLPALLALIEKARVARVENDLEAEARFLEEALAADPTRSALAARLTTVRAALREQRFAAHIAAGLARVAERDLAAARKQLADARAVYPDRAEGQALAREIAVLARELQAARLLREARAAAGADDWASAARHYQQAGEILPNDSEAAEGHALATRIVALDGKLARHLDAPHRLASENVAGAAAALVADAQTVSGHSAGLAARVERLAGMLAAYAAQIPVRVLSDGVTEVSVRGVGRVGATTDRTIELRPGRYTFEGRRPGYRSKLVEIEIPPGSPLLVIEIACDERI